MGSKEATVYWSDYDLDFNVSRETQAQLDALKVRLNVPTTITMKASTLSKLLSCTREKGNKIPFFVVALKYRVRLPLAPFVKQFLGKLPLHPL